MTDPLPLSHPVRTAGLSTRTATPFDLRPNGPERAGLAAYLDILAIPEMRFRGTITPTGRRDLVLDGELTARVVQPCVVTLEPVTTRLTERVERRYVEDFVLPEGDEVEMPEDDGIEPLPQAIDLGAVATEALALALPLYPRAPGAALGETVHAADGVVPLRDADLRPFAGLAGLAIAPGAAGSADDPRRDGSGGERPASDGTDGDGTDGDGGGDD
jgi:uncharacterized metal-binding protein YceD (DUF177 family)